VKALRDRDAVCLSLPALVACVIVLHIVGVIPRNNQLTLTDLLVILGISIVFSVLGMGASRRRVVLYEDAIEVTGWFSTRKMKRTEILGRRGRSTPYGYRYTIVPTDANARPLFLPGNLDLDKYFSLWMKGIPIINKG
jgi:hypothetical protein